MIQNKLTVESMQHHLNWITSKLLSIELIDTLCFGYIKQSKMLKIFFKYHLNKNELFFKKKIVCLNMEINDNTKYSSF